MSGVQMSRKSLPVTVAYKSGVALSDTPTDVGDGIYEPIADYKGFKHAAATMMRTDTGTDAPPLQVANPPVPSSHWQLVTRPVVARTPAHRPRR